MVGTISQRRQTNCKYKNISVINLYGMRSRKKKDFILFVLKLMTERIISATVCYVNKTNT